MKPYKVFAANPDPAAMSQFYEAMKQDAAVRGAVMPDVHKGYVLPIGAVIATDGVVYPSYCGYDIGCGVCGVSTTFSKELIIEKKDAILAKIFELVPVGVGSYRNVQVAGMVPDNNQCTDTLVRLYKERKGDLQLGTLGGGNHFIEVGYDGEQKVWIVIHSGSRGFGHSVATHYMKLAAGDNKNVEGHYGFRVDSQQGEDYIADLNFCLEFALFNRQTITNHVVMALRAVGIPGDVERSTLINRNHNHIVEREGLWIHRKGATHAEKDMWGVIPGNMRDGSFIVKGLGNPDALWSSAHGAGRVMSRGQARKTIQLETFRGQMAGIAAKTDASVIDEAPDAYKNIFEVIEQHELLAEVVQHVNPIISGKG